MKFFKRLFGKKKIIIRYDPGIIDLNDSGIQISYDKLSDSDKKKVKDKLNSMDLSSLEKMYFFEDIEDYDYLLTIDMATHMCFDLSNIYNTLVNKQDNNIIDSEIDALIISKKIEIVLSNSNVILKNIELDIICLNIILDNYKISVRVRNSILEMLDRFNKKYISLFFSISGLVREINSTHNTFDYNKENYEDLDNYKEESIKILNDRYNFDKDIIKELFDINDNGNIDNYSFDNLISFISQIEYRIDVYVKKNLLSFKEFMGEFKDKEIDNSKISEYIEKVNKIIAVYKYLNFSDDELMEVYKFKYKLLISNISEYSESPFKDITMPELEIYKEIFKKDYEEFSINSKYHDLFAFLDEKWDFPGEDISYNKDDYKDDMIFDIKNLKMIYTDSYIYNYILDRYNDSILMIELNEFKKFDVSKIDDFIKIGEHVNVWQFSTSYCFLGYTYFENFFIITFNDERLYNKIFCMCSDLISLQDILEEDRLNISKLGNIENNSIKEVKIGKQAVCWAHFDSDSTYDFSCFHKCRNLRQLDVYGDVILKKDSFKDCKIDTVTFYGNVKLLDGAFDGADIKNINFMQNDDLNVRSIINNLSEDTTIYIHSNGNLNVLGTPLPHDKVKARVKVIYE